MLIIFSRLPKWIAVNLTQTAVQFDFRTFQIAFIHVANVGAGTFPGLFVQQFHAEITVDHILHLFLADALWRFISGGV